VGASATQLPAVWAARTMIALDSGRYEELLASIRAPHPGGDDAFWPQLAQAKVELTRGNAAGALSIYRHMRLEQRLDDPEIGRENTLLGGAAAILDVACARQMTGDQADTDKLIARAEGAIAADRERGVNPNRYDYLLAAAASLRGDQARAAALLRFAHERGWREYASFQVDPRFNRFGDRATLLASLKSPKPPLAATASK
jgi:hypothetical protein